LGGFNGNWVRNEERIVKGKVSSWGEPTKGQKEKDNKEEEKEISTTKICDARGGGDQRNREGRENGGTSARLRVRKKRQKRGRDRKTIPSHRTRNCVIVRLRGSEGG